MSNAQKTAGNERKESIQEDRGHATTPLRLSQKLRALKNVVLRTASMEKSGLPAIARVPKTLDQGWDFIENTTQ